MQNFEERRERKEKYFPQKSASMSCYVSVVFCVNIKSIPYLLLLLFIESLSNVSAVLHRSHSVQFFFNQFFFLQCSV